MKIKILLSIAFLVSGLFEAVASDKKLIGRIERIDLPELGLRKIRAKIDSGAYTSSIHCSYIKKKIENGKAYVYFKILDETYPQFKNKTFRLPIIEEKKVKSSSGESELRYFVSTTLFIVGDHFPIYLSLTDRSELKYPILLGRRAVIDRYLIDVSKANLTKKYRVQKLKK